MASPGFIPVLDFSVPCFEVVGRLQRSGSRLSGNLDLVLRAVGLTGSGWGLTGSKAWRGKGERVPGGRGFLAVGGGVERCESDPGAPRRWWVAAVCLFGKQRVTTTSERGEPREWKSRAASGQSRIIK